MIVAKYLKIDLLQYDMRVCLGDLESNMVFQCETVLFESITEQAQMMAWTGRLLKIKSKDGCHPLLFWFTNPTACL